MTIRCLHEVQEAIRTGERAGFGLAAVAERIALYYGPGYGMTISSKEGEKVQRWNYGLGKIFNRNRKKSNLLKMRQKDR